MLSTTNKGKYVDKMGSVDSHTTSGKLNALFSEDMEVESPTKKNGKMLKKFGVFMKVHK